MEPNYGIATGAYEDDRNDWPRAIERAAREGWPFLELTAFGEARLDLLPTLDAELFKSFQRVSIHAPVRDDPTVTIELLLTLDGDVILHPDVYGAVAAVDRLGTRAVFENMDIAKSFGKDVDDLVTVFAAHGQAGFCLDVAHVLTNDESLSLGHDLLDAFGERLRQVHVSGIKADGTHRETTAADLELYRPLLKRCREVPWLLEAELAPGLVEHA
jgi:hypothetical protein